MLFSFRLGDEKLNKNKFVLKRAFKKNNKRQYKRAAKVYLLLPFRKMKETAETERKNYIFRLYYIYMYVLYLYRYYIYIDNVTLNEEKIFRVELEMYMSVSFLLIFFCFLIESANLLGNFFFVR